jgi:cell division protein FtsQ
MIDQAIPRDLAQAVRSGNLFSSRGSSVLDSPKAIAPEPGRAQQNSGAQGLKRRASLMEMPLRRDKSYVESFPSDYSEDIDREFSGRARRPGVRLSFGGGLVPKSLWGKIAAGGALLLIAAAVFAGAMWVRGFLLSDEHFTVLSPASIQIAGNSHLTRAQLLSVFGGYLDRNIFRVPLDRRKAELEGLPWVAHATVMRLLPNRIRVGIVERTPVAFVRHGTQIGLVDGNGVLFDVPEPQPESSSPTPHYSFPVLTGISLSDPLSTRAARVRLYMEFLASLDSGGDAISKRVSEVDLSNPEDVKAIIPDANTQANVLVHFGEDRYLERYHEYQNHLAEWKTQCPRLSSADMRYDQQVVLEPCAPAPDAAPAASIAETTPGKAIQPKAPRVVPAAAKPVAVKPKATLIRRNLIKAKGKPMRAASHGAGR